MVIHRGHWGEVTWERRIDIAGTCSGGVKEDRLAGLPSEDNDMICKDGRGIRPQRARRNNYPPIPIHAVECKIIRG